MGKHGKHGKAHHYDISEESAPAYAGTKKIESMPVSYDILAKKAQIVTSNPEDAVFIHDDEFTNQVREVAKSLAVLQKKALEENGLGDRGKNYYMWQSYVNKFGTTNPVKIAEHLVLARSRIAEFYTASDMINDALQDGEYEFSGSKTSVKASVLKVGPTGVYVGSVQGGKKKEK